MVLVFFEIASSRKVVVGPSSFLSFSGLLAEETTLGAPGDALLPLELDE